jgi:hypothetical protein
MKPKGSRNKKGVSRILNCHGYYEKFEPTHPLAKKNGYVLEHRMIAYAAGLIKDAKMEVHHKNEIKTDNRLKNLEITTHAAHARLHWKGSKQKLWTKERREAVSKRMKGNKNWAGRSRNPELIAKGGAA